MNVIDKARERLELAQVKYPFCSYCGEPMDIVDHDGALWIECSALARAGSGLRGRLARSLHDHHVAVDYPEMARAA